MTEPICYVLAGKPGAIRMDGLSESRRRMMARVLILDGWTRVDPAAYEVHLKQWRGKE